MSVRDLTGFRPMLSATIPSDTQEELLDSIEKLDYPLWTSPKIDGIRCVVHPHLGPVTRSLKPIPNQFIRKELSDPRYHYLDGELVVCDPTDPRVFNQTASGVMSHEGTPNFTFLVFDLFEFPTNTYFLRYAQLIARLEQYKNDPSFRAKEVQQKSVLDQYELLAQELEAVEQGYEGLMVRHGNAPYKFNRSTFTQQYLMKLKRYRDAEATVVGFEPLMRNLNDPVPNELGLTKRSSHQANKVADDLLGKLIVKGNKGQDWDSVEFSIGSGFDVELRRLIWLHQDEYLGKQVTYRWLPHGSLDKPRHPTFKRFRPYE